MSADKKISKPFSKPVFLVVAAALGLMFLASGFTAIGFVAAHQLYSHNGAQQPLVLKADSAASGKSLSFATGIVARDVEGLFVLDHLTGTLQCWLLNPQTGTIGGIFTANVSTDLGSVKAADADYVMVAVRIDTTGLGRESTLRPGESIVYVGDGNTGNVVAYGLQVDRTLFLQGKNVQKGQMEIVARGIARGAVERDQ